MIKSKNQRKRPEVNHKQIALSILVIALSAVIAVNADSSISLDQKQQSAPIATNNNQQENQKTSADLGAKSSLSAPISAAEPMKKQLESEKIESNKGSAEVAAESKLSPKVDITSKVSTEDVAHKADGGDNKQAMSPSSKETDLVAKTNDSESNKRKARADTASTAAAPPSETKQEAAKPAAETKKTESKLDPKASPATPAAAAAKPIKQLAKSASKSKLPANLGTVTSTGSGGHSYMSKHDAYSAIAEKHGALAQDAMKKSDKRQLQTGFGSIQKASGIGDVLSPFKGVTDSGLARTLGASMRSIMKSKYSVPAYVASALLGAVALMAFYESPISPLPVPALPEPPVGRFPPEMPNLPVGTQVPFRMGNQQGGGQYGQSYNQRSLNQQMPSNYLAQQAQQVLFPSNNVAQQRQMNVANGPVQQLASNLLSSVGGKQQIAQRKSSPDYDLSSRSFFGSTLPVASPKQGIASSSLSSASGQSKQGNSFLSYFGFGGQSNSVPTESNNNNNNNNNIQSAQGAMQMSGMSNLNLQNQANIPQASGSSVEPKGAANQAGALSNSHLVNKFKSLFSRSPSHSSATGSSHSSAISSASGNPYEPYQRMSLVQALMKDTAFIPGFLTPSRKSSTNSGSSQSGAANKLQSTLTNALSGSQNPSSRMQVESGPSSSHLQAALKQNNKQSSGSDSGYGLYRVAHALLETFTSGVGHARQANSHGSGGNQLSESVARKSSSSDDSSSPSLAAATSLIGDIMSSYNTVNNGEQQQQQQPQSHEKSASQSQAQSSSSPSSSSSQSSASQSSSSSLSSSSLSSNQQSANNQQQPNDQISARSGEIAVSNNDHEHDQQNVKSQSAPNSVAQVSSNNKPSQATSSASPQDAHVRKTRSIGFEYPIESNQELAKREQQPSKASQINNVIDFVADSYSQNRILFNFVMNQVGLSQAVPYVEQILAPGANEHH